MSLGFIVNKHNYEILKLIYRTFAQKNNQFLVYTDTFDSDIASSSDDSYLIRFKSHVLREEQIFSKWKGGYSHIGICILSGLKWKRGGG